MSKSQKTQKPASLVVVESELQEYKTMYKVNKPPVLWSRYLVLTSIFLAPFILGFLILFYYANPLNDSLYVLIPLFFVLTVYCSFRGGFYYYDVVKKLRDGHPKPLHLRPKFPRMGKASIRILRVLKYAGLVAFWYIHYLFLFISPSQVQVVWL